MFNVHLYNHQNCMVKLIFDVWKFLCEKECNVMFSNF